MKGIVFTVLNELVENQFGMDVWDSLLNRTGHDGAYTTAASYPDAEAMSLVAGLSAHTGLPVNDLVRVFGRYLFGAFERQYPVFFQLPQTAKEFLKSVDEIIHVEVRKLYPDAVLPVFEYEDPAENRLVMLYRSTRQLCPLAEGLLEGAAAHFQTSIQYEQTKCTHRGDDHCRFELLLGGEHDNN
ncbi:MAG: heme NO-binding domain-containing protein [Planctomycetaceae bacterium]